MTSCRQIVTPLPFFRFIANLEQFGSRIPDAWSVKLTFSLTVTFSPTKTEKKLKNLLHSSPYCFEQRYHFYQKYSFPFDACDCTRTHQHTRHQFDSCKRQHAPLLFMTLIVWDIGTKKMKEITKTPNLIVYNFSLTFVNLSLGLLLCLHVQLHIRGKFLVWSE